MAERLHPNTLPLSTDPQTTSSEENAFASNAVPKPPGESYIIQLPKDQVYRIPPPENARRYQNYTRKKNRRSCCCLCWLIGIVFTLIMLVTVAACVFYLIFRPQVPQFSIDGVAVQGMNLTSSLSTISPECAVSVSDDNGNNKIGIYYEKGSIVEIFYRDIKICNGALPVFYQPTNSVTRFQTVLKGNVVALAVSDRRALVRAVAKRSVPLTLKLRVPLKFKVGSVKTGQFLEYKMECNLTLDQLTAQSKITVIEDCNSGFYFGSD